ncbi:DNA-binding IclR family transcriptional regulator [Nocardioides daedukensis]|uniref:DNA-binding IclR family transcriptional regulator n=1 Tax=Nocardioides daedukensis TaxID=634462 RepID=A0A7Y9RYJ0_9ACTN|nr:DNA-binding IclR family transcriptional regulator [Nocardioides daedukensis]
MDHQLVGRIGRILRAAAQGEPGGLSTTELASKADLARPTAHRLLTALQAEGLIDRDGAGHWTLGPEMFLLGTTAAKRYDVTDLARASVRRLSEDTGESAFFSARRGDETVCLLREDGSFPIRSHVLHEGIRFPLGVASAGIAILSYLPAREAKEHLVAHELTERFGRTHSRAAIERRMAETRRTGWAVNPGLLVEGSWGMAAAVFGADTQPHWALSLTGIERRFEADRQPELGRLLLQEAHDLTVRIQRSRPG